MEDFDGAPADDPRHLRRLDPHLGSGFDWHARPDQQLAAAGAVAGDVDRAVDGVAHEHHRPRSQLGTSSYVGTQGLIPGMKGLFNDADLDRAPLSRADGACTILTSL